MLQIKSGDMLRLRASPSLSFGGYRAEEGEWPCQTVRNLPVPKVSAPGDVERHSSYLFIHYIPISSVVETMYLHLFFLEYIRAIPRNDVDICEYIQWITSIYIGPLQLILIFSSRLRRITGTELGNLLVPAARAGDASAAR
jgi:hypothetical protein